MKLKENKHWSNKLLAILHFFKFKVVFIATCSFLACVADANYRRVNVRLQRRLVLVWYLHFCITVLLFAVAIMAS